jgi:polar amino acid transport system substrate-binding protein
MEIPQAMGTGTGKRAETAQYLRDLIEELKATGFIEASLRRSGQTAPVAPPA